MNLLLALLVLLVSSEGREVETLYRQGLAAGKAGDFARAEQRFQSALAADSRHIPSKRALDLLADRSVALVQDAVAAALFRGMSLQDRGDGTGAEREYRKAVEGDPRYYFALHELGVARYNAGDDAGAIELYGRALEGKPDYAYTHNNLGLAYARIGQHEKACEHYRLALDINPYYYKVYNNLGVSLTALGEKKEADELLRTALELKPGYALASANLAAREPAPPERGREHEGPPTSALLQMLESASGDERNWATEQLLARSDPEAVPSLLELLGAERAEVRAAAVLVLGKAGSPLAVDGLLALLLHDKDWVVRFEAAAALAQTGDGRALEPLAQAASKDSDFHVRRNAAAWLRMFPGCVGARTLSGALTDPVSEVRVSASASLAAMSGQDLGQDPGKWAPWVAATCAQESTTGER